MFPGEFHENDVEPYQAFEDYAGPFESIYYMGCGIDTTPSKTFQTDDILHVDHDPAAVQYLNENGLDAETADVTHYTPEKEFDLVILAHLTAKDRPLIEEALREDGAVICSTSIRAEKLSQQTDLSLDAVHRDGEINQGKELIQDAEKYFFR